ncbi:hypothetical protein WA158_008056 [Blastocystis sp. Blastoise]
MDIFPVTEAKQYIQGPIVYENNGIKCYQGKNLLSNSKGTLVMTNDYLVWYDESENKAIVLQYNEIGLHAISKGHDVNPEPCLYCQVFQFFYFSDLACDCDDENGGNIPEMCFNEDDFDETNVNSNASNITEDDYNHDDEIYFVPEIEEQLDEMFSNLSNLQRLHPDPDNSDESDDEFLTADNINQADPEALERMCNLFSKAEEEYLNQQGIVECTEETDEVDDDLIN